MTAITVEHPDGSLERVEVRLHPIGIERMSGSLITYLIEVLVVSLLSLIVGIWVVAARPADPNAWFVLVILTFPRVCEPTWFPALVWLGLFFREPSLSSDVWLEYLHQFNIARLSGRQDWKGGRTGSSKPQRPPLLSSSWHLSSKNWCPPQAPMLGGGCEC